MPAFVITSKPHRPGQTMDAVLCDPNVAGHPDRRTDVPIRARISDQTLTIDDEPRPRAIISSVGQNGTTTFLVHGSTTGLRNKERRVALERASTIRRQLTDILRPLTAASEEPELASEGQGLLYNWLAEERERLMGS